MARRKRPPVTLHAHPVLDPSPGDDELDMIIAYSQRKNGLHPDEYHEYTGACLSLGGPMALALRAAWEREGALIVALRETWTIENGADVADKILDPAIQHEVPDWWRPEYQRLWHATRAIVDAHAERNSAE